MSQLIFCIIDASKNVKYFIPPDAIIAIPGIIFTALFPISQYLLDSKNDNSKNDNTDKNVKSSFNIDREIILNKLLKVKVCIPALLILSFASVFLAEKLNVVASLASISIIILFLIMLRKSWKWLTDSEREGKIAKSFRQNLRLHYLSDRDDVNDIIGAWQEYLSALNSNDLTRQSGVIEQFIITLKRLINQKESSVLITELINCFLSNLTKFSFFDKKEIELLVDFSISGFIPDSYKSIISKEKREIFLRSMITVMEKSSKNYYPAIDVYFFDTLETKIHDFSHELQFKLYHDILYRIFQSYEEGRLIQLQDVWENKFFNNLAVNIKNNKHNNRDKMILALYFKTFWRQLCIPFRDYSNREEKESVKKGFTEITALMFRDIDPQTWFDTFLLMYDKSWHSEDQLMRKIDSWSQAEDYFYQWYTYIYQTNTKSDINTIGGYDNSLIPLKQNTLAFLMQHNFINIKDDATCKKIINIVDQIINTISNIDEINKTFRLNKLERLKQEILLIQEILNKKT